MVNPYSRVAFIVDIDGNAPEISAETLDKMNTVCFKNMGSGINFEFVSQLS